MSLRARLLLGLVALATIGLVAADVATYTSLRSFLLRRVDEQLHSAQLPVLRAFGLSAGRRGGPPAPTFGVAPGTYAEIRSSDGGTRSATFVSRDEDPVLEPALPDALPAGSFTLEAGGGSPGFRVLASDLGPAGTLVVAMPLDEVQRTLSRLLAIMAAVTVGVLGGLGALSLVVVGVSLSPLRRMEDTAEKIAAGDLSRRIEDDDPSTEVGRLGASLNAMLHQIERAFQERTASENRLRRFLADASHELRTPITSIRGYAELFRRGASHRPEDLEKAMRRIEQEAERMGVMVDDLLLLARLDQGRPLDREPVDLAAVAEDALADAKAGDPERQLTLTISGESQVVRGDEPRLRQVAANLLSNAMVHTAALVPVEVSVRAENAEVLLEVADHGAGIGPEHAPHVFERFYRADAGRARESGGSGLGLSIVDAIARAHGGRAEHEPTPGGGATFRVVLPRIDATAGEASEETDATGT